MPNPPTPPYNFDSLMNIVESLLGPEGCPWDKKQTHQSLTKYCIEETYEFKEAVDNNDYQHMKEELGDILFQIALHSQLAKNNNHFTVDEVIKNISEKMIRRHPHVFTDQKVQNIEDVYENWEAIKNKEKPERKTNLFEAPKGLPSLMRAHKVGKKTKKLDFDFNSTQEALIKIDEELSELIQAIENKDTQNIEEEIGDLLFTITCLARQEKIDSEEALNKTLNKFIHRMDLMFEDCKQNNVNFESLSRDEKEQLWIKAKKR